MRALIIPDLHHHTGHADHWLRTQYHDRVIFLGDYFDDFQDDVADARATATWLRHRIETTDDIFLLGNHDVAYMHPHLDALFCAGFSRAKSRGIREVLQPAHWQRFKLAHAEQGWLLSHAGFHPTWLPEPGLEGFLSLAEEALEQASDGRVSPLLGAGTDRGGDQPVGGPLWLDWSSFVPIPGINQIVGHTPAAEVRELSVPGSQNCCLDVRQGSVAALLEDGRISILRHTPQPHHA